MNKFSLFSIFARAFQKVVNPYKGEHSAKIREQEEFKELADWAEEGQFRRTNGGTAILPGCGEIEIPSTISIIWGQLTNQSGDEVAVQSLRFPIESYSEQDAVNWLTENKIEYLKFESSEPQSKKELRHIVLNSVDRKCELTLYGYIGGEVDGNEIAKEIHAVNKWKAADEIVIRINSEGGSVFNGLAIVSAILNSEIPVTTCNDGLAASMAGIIFASGKRRIMADYSLLMLHAPYINDDEYEIDETGKQLIARTKNALVSILANRTGRTIEDISAMLSKETWFDAWEAAKEKFCDEIKVIKPEFEVTPEMGIENKLMKIAAHYNLKVNNLTTNKKEKMKSIIEKLGLAEDATEQDILNKIDELNGIETTLAGQIENLKSENETLRTSQLTSEEREKQLHESLCIAEVENAIKDGKFDESEKENLLASAKSNLESFKAIVASVKVVSVPKVSNQLESKIDLTSFGIKEEDANFAYLEKHNPQALAKIKIEQPVIFKKLYDAYEADILRSIDK